MLDVLFFKEGIIMGILSWILIGCLAWLLFLLGAYCFKGIYIHINTNEIVEENVLAVVVDKEYESGYTSVRPVGKVMMPVIHSEEYNVCLEYNNEEFVFDCEELYDQVKIGDKIPAKLVKYMSKSGEILDTELKIDF